MLLTNNINKFMHGKNVAINTSLKITFVWTIKRIGHLVGHLN